MSTYRRRHKENAAKRVFRMLTVGQMSKYNHRKGCRKCRAFGVRFCPAHNSKAPCGHTWHYDVVNMPPDGELWCLVCEASVLSEEGDGA